MLSKKETTTSHDNKKYLFDSVYAQTEFSTHYLYQLIFSAIITVFGLLNNNNVVIIGAMLISPLFWPVMGVALGIITTRRHIMKNSTKSFFISILMVIFVSFVIARFVPITELPEEILLRINPNILDLFIALAISIIGVLGLYYPTISSTATGVAISISLLPPLCIVGIGLAKGMFDMVWKSLLLFGTNIGAIVFMGVIVLYLLKIRPRKQEEEKRFKFGVLISGTLMILMSIPLSFYLKESVRQNHISNLVKRTMTEEIRNIENSARVETVVVDFLSLGKKVPLNVEAKVYLPEGVYMTQSEREKLLEKLSDVTERDINLSFSIINTVSLRSEEDFQKTELRKRIREIVSDTFNALDGNIELDDVQVVFPGTTTEENLINVNITVQVKQYSDYTLSYSDVENLKSKLDSELNIASDLEIELIPISRVTESPIDYSVYQKLVSGFEKLIFEESELAEVTNVSIKGELVIVSVKIPSNIVFSDETKTGMEELAKEILGENTKIQLRIERFEVN